jgi:AcrR family transcriptional regulator
MNYPERLEVAAIAARTPAGAEPQVRTRDPERKNRILTAAADLVARKGFHAVSIAEIGGAAGITGSGVYRHFDSKSAVLVALFDRVIDGLLRDEQKIWTAPPTSARRSTS